MRNMNLLITALFVLLQNIEDLQAENLADTGNKTKRTISPNVVQNYGENKPLLYYNDNSGAPSDFSGFYSPVTIKPVFDSDVPKQVAAQQVLYEFQQTPTNAVSNVHVNQVYQPIGNGQKHQNLGQNQQQLSETVVNPVQHATLVRHNHNLGPVQFQTPIPHHVQTQQYIPGKYFYVNGKIVYQPHQINQPQLQQVPLARLNNYQNLPQNPRLKFVPTVVPRPVNYNAFNPPQQYQKITKPSIVENVQKSNDEAAKEEDEERKTPSKEERNEDEEQEDVEDSEDYEESDDEDEDDDHRNFFHKYSFEDEDEDEDDDRPRYHHDDDDDEDEDNSRKSTKQINKKYKNKSKSNKNRNDHYRSSKSSKSNIKKRQQQKSPKIKYQAMKYTRTGSGKPKIEYIEGGQSKHIPVVHQQKVFKEKWFVSKSTDNLSGA